MKTNNTKRAFMSSVLALVLCIAMLIGTTFAWFTDSVTSGRNVIQSGNLDVELYYSVLDDNGAWTQYAKVDSTTDVFGYEYWEPGYTAVAKFKIVNEGNLALKYQLTADVYDEVLGKTKDNADIKLSDYLRYGVTETLAALEDRAVAAAVATTAFGSFNLKAATLGKGDSAEVGMVITMPTTVGNEANHNGTDIPSISFGINLVATQLNSEADSFGSDYDAQAQYPLFGFGVANGNEAEEVTAGDVSLTIPAGKNGDYVVKVENKDVTTNAAGETTVSYDISLYKDGVKVSADGTKYLVEINIGSGLTVTGVTHNGVAVPSFTYNAVTGEATFETDSFSPFAVTYAAASSEEVKVSTGEVLGDTLDAAPTNGDVVKVVLQNNMFGGLVVKKYQNVILDLNGYTLQKDSGAAADADTIANFGALTIIDSSEAKTGLVRGDGAVSGGVVIHNYEGAALTMKGIDVDGNAAGGAGSYTVVNAGEMIIDATSIYDTATNASLVVNTAGEMTITGTSVLKQPKAKNLDVKGGVVIVDNACIKSDECPIYVADGWVYVKEAIVEAVNNGTIHALTVENGKLVITGGTFIIDPSVYVAEGYEAVRSSKGVYVVLEEGTTLPEDYKPEDLPVAIVSDMDEYENVEIPWNTQFGIAPTRLTQQLESVYKFAAQDDYTAAQQSNYAGWTTDYYVTLDRDIEVGQLVLGGNYGSFGWIGFENPMAVAANTPTPLLGTAGMEFTYTDIVQLVQEFICGVADVDNALSGATITVELRVTNPSDTTEYYVINNTQYTFK